MSAPIIGAILSLCIWHGQGGVECARQFVALPGATTLAECERFMTRQVVRGMLRTYYNAAGERVTPAYETCTYQEGRK